MTQKTDARPSVTLAIATGFGLGYLPIAPGTWGSLGGVAIYSLLSTWMRPRAVDLSVFDRHFAPSLPPTSQIVAALALGLLGVWVAGRAVRHFRLPDPHPVVIDEISGQELTYLLGWSSLNWKYLLLGFILFRVFDVWKPFPARQVEAWPGGWGIMADDWFAALYAALGLWVARALGI